MQVGLQTQPTAARAEFARLAGVGLWEEARALALREMALAAERPDFFAWLVNVSQSLWGLLDFRGALAVADAAGVILDDISDPWLLGCYHNARALAHRGLYQFDLALIDYAAADFYFELAGREDRLAMVKANVGYLYVKIGKREAALENLKKALAIYTRLEDWHHAEEVCRSLKEAEAVRGEG